MDRYRRYALILVWVARLVAFLTLFYPMGVYLATMLLLVAEIFHLLNRFVQGLEEGGKEEG